MVGRLKSLTHSCSGLGTVMITRWSLSTCKWGVQPVFLSVLISPFWPVNLADIAQPRESFCEYHLYTYTCAVDSVSVAYV